MSVFDELDFEKVLDYFSEKEDGAEFENLIRSISLNSHDKEFMTDVVILMHTLLAVHNYINSQSEYLTQISLRNAVKCIPAKPQQEYTVFGTSIRFPTENTTVHIRASSPADAQRRVTNTFAMNVVAVVEGHHVNAC